MRVRSRSHYATGAAPFRIIKFEFQLGKSLHVCPIVVRLPSSFEDALERVRNSTSSSEGYAFLGDATDIRYQVIKALQETIY